MATINVVRVWWESVGSNKWSSVKIRWYHRDHGAGHMWVTKPMGNTYGKYLWDDYWDDYCWLVVSTYLPRKMMEWVRQLGWWNSQLNGKKHVPNHQPAICLAICGEIPSKIGLNYLVPPINRNCQLVRAKMMIPKFHWKQPCKLAEPQRLWEMIFLLIMAIFGLPCQHVGGYNRFSII